LPSPPGVSAEQQRRTLDFIAQGNRDHLEGRPGDSELAARIAAYELAFRMQAHAPEVVDVAGETEGSKRLYGLDRKETAEFGLRCLLARRMIERGVRFVQLYSGDTNGWDAHSDLEGNHGKLCLQSDLPIAGLLQDLKRRGLLDSTLVIWGGEFGRTPFREGRTAGGNLLGRDHYPDCYSLVLAGAGIKGGYTHGESDDLGFYVARDKVHVHDFQATILHLLGFDHTKLTFRFQGRDYRLTDVHGHVVKDVLA
jgi:Protein of unknown function (DUF1501)